jgi:hypothetical protein
VVLIVQFLDHKENPEHQAAQVDHKAVLDRKGIRVQVE